MVLVCLVLQSGGHVSTPAPDVNGQVIDLTFKVRLVKLFAEPIGAG